MMKKVSKKKKVKGFTLVECMIALCVFAIGANVLAVIGQTLNDQVKNAIHTQEKLCVEAPRAQSKETGAGVTPSKLGITDPSVRDQASLQFDYSVTDKNGLPINGSVLVYADTYSALASTDEHQDGAHLHYMVFDMDLVGGKGGAKP
ncbi:MAG: prepilin-type N-terminal cleavage/methylation domain-containing protein [Ruminococcus sp.]|nr:prepilin-type N-terminal cleavage/methylation domain-containing protein [Ruminococcus sp.]